VAFSPDSRTLASGSKDNTLKLWDAKTGSKLLTLEGHSARSMAFSPNSQVLASDSTDGTIKLWDAGTGKELQTINSHLHEVRSISFAPDHQSSYKLKPQVSMNYGWVAFEGEKLLWLPSEYRYFSSCAIKDSTLALGYDNGRVFILGFNTSMG
jgi:WD40 repeat protein